MMCSDKKIIIVIAVIAIMLQGCATNKQLEEVRVLAEQAKADSVSALQIAENADSKADQALQVANDSNEKIDNMFKKAMQK